MILSKIGKKCVCSASMCTFYGWENCPCDTRVTLSCHLHGCPPAERPLHSGTRRIHVPHFSVVLFSFHSVVHPPAFLHSDVSSRFCVIVVCTTWGQTVGTSLGTRYHPNWTRTGMPRGPPRIAHSLLLCLSPSLSLASSVALPPCLSLSLSLVQVCTSSKHVPLNHLMSGWILCS